MTIGATNEGRRVNRVFSICLGAIAVATLSACGSTPPDTEQQAEPELETKAIGNGFFAANAPETISPEKWPAMAKAKCGALPFCQVYIWPAGTPLPGAMPFTDPEVAGIRYRYAVNRETGYEASLWDCQTFPQPDTSACLGDPE